MPASVGTPLWTCTGRRHDYLCVGMSLDKQRRQLESRPPVVVATPGRLWELMSEGSSHLQAHLAALLTRQPLVRSHSLSREQLLTPC